MTSRLKADLALFLVAVIWGSAFVAQRVAALHESVFVFNGLRFLLAAFVILPFIRPRWKPDRKTILLVIVAGAILFAGSALQQAGMRYTTAGNAGFITGLYVVFVPVILGIFWRERPHWLIWIAVLFAALGVFFLSTSGETFRQRRGDDLELAGALFWALHVIVIAKFAPQVSILQFAAGQNLVCGALNLLTGLLVEYPQPGQLAGLWWSIAYAGIISVGIGYTLQVAAQRYTPATDAALIMSAEAVMAALFGYLLLGETLNPVQLVGCALIMAAILLAQARNGKIRQLFKKSSLEGP